MSNILKSIKGLFNKIPSWHQWQKIPSVLNKKERYFILGFVFLAIAGLFGWLISYNIQHTILVPAYGGSFSEGIVGSPQYINPILSQTSDADRDVSELIFSGLMQYDSKGNLIPDLAEKYSIGDSGKIYDFFLKKDVKWHDGQPFTADDVIFTINAIQNPTNRSPLRINWSSVQVEKIDDFTVRFKLNAPYAPFLANTTVGMLPSHIWKDISPEKFILAPENLLPVGTGHYELKKTKKDKDGFITYMELDAFGEYDSAIRPFIDKIYLYFYPSEEELIKAYNQGKIDNLALISNQNKNALKSVGIKSKEYELNLPRYFAIFFNQSNSTALSDKNVRLALNYATDKKEIIDKVLQGKGKQIDSPIPTNVLGDSNGLQTYEFNLDKAKEILEQNGWKDTDGDGIREKKNEKLAIGLVTTEMNQLRQSADIIKEQWAKVGVQVDITISNIGEIQQQYIRPREYQAILFGEVLGLDPDPYSFWHSSQKKDPGLNLALYDNAKVDTLLKDARQLVGNDQLRSAKYKEFQQLVINDAPVVFLYSPYQLYFTAKDIKGISVENIVLPSMRFVDIENWYIKTQRVKKEE